MTVMRPQIDQGTPRGSRGGEAARLQTALPRNPSARSSRRRPQHWSLPYDIDVDTVAPRQILSPVAVEILGNASTTITVRLKEDGIVTIWDQSAKSALHSSQCKLRRTVYHCWEADIRTPDTVIEISR